MPKLDPSDVDTPTPTDIALTKPLPPGQTSTSTPATTTPAFGATSTPAFGASTPSSSFGGSSFGGSSMGGGFGGSPMGGMGGGMPAGMNTSGQSTQAMNLQSTGGAMQEGGSTTIETSKGFGDFINSKWRPMMAVIYMVTCMTDFVVFPVLWSVLQALFHGTVTSQWAPLTLQGAGLYHIAMGAVLGLAAYGRSQEKIAGKA